ncbi:MAG TPA: hypothetical protein VGN88_07340 [Phycisphaerae bacterium]
MAVSATDAIGPAMRRTGKVLFQPFRFKKWMVLAVGAWLASLGEGGGSGGSFNSSGGGRGPGAGGGGAPAKNFAETMQDVGNWITTYLTLILVIAGVAIVLGFCIYLVVRWLSARGQFIFLDNIVSNKAEVKKPWAAFREIAFSLFKFRIYWDLAWFNAYLALSIIAAALAWHDFKAGLIQGDYPFTAWTIWAIVLMAGGCLLLLPVWAFLHLLIFKLAIPVMYVRRIRLWPAVKETWRELFMPHKGACLVFFLMLIVTGMAQALWGILAIIVLAIATCCIGYFLLLIPFFGGYVLALVTLPPLVFSRAYALHFIEQFGTAYEVSWQDELRGGFPVILDVPPDVPPAAL